MRPIRFVLHLLVAALGMVLAAGVRAETLTIATYNVENYVATNRMTEAGFRKGYPKPEAQKAALRTVIRGLNADVILLQEMGGAAYLEELRRDLRTDGVEYAEALVLEAADDDRHVAVLSRRPFSSVVRHATLEFAYFGGKERVKRGLLELHLATSAGDLVIFALHLKSRFTDRPDDPRSARRREGEAEAIRAAVLRRCPDPATARFVIAGDFNDDKGSKAVQRLRRRGEAEIAELLPATDARGETWTHVYRKEDSYTRVDHVLVSPALRAHVAEQSARIYDGAGVAEASDHRPVVITLRFP